MPFPLGKYLFLLQNSCGHFLWDRANVSLFTVKLFFVGSPKRARAQAKMAIFSWIHIFFNRQTEREYVCDALGGKTIFPKLYYFRLRFFVKHDRN